MSVDLYPEPEDTLRATLEYLVDRLMEERAEVKRFKALEVERKAGLRELIARAEEDAALTSSLVKDYRAALKRVAT